MHFFVFSIQILSSFEVMENMNEKIRRIRKSKGLKQTDVCEKIGITQPSFASIEAGRTKSISIDLGKSIAKVLDVDFNYLFEIGLPNNQNEDLIKEIERLKKQILVLEEQVEDKRKINIGYANSIDHFKQFMEFFSFTIIELLEKKKAITQKKDFEKLYKKFLDEKGIKTNVFKDNDFLFAFFTANEIDHLTKEKP